jgi:glycosyltransferase involved in cell wall biosynthesis
MARLPIESSLLLKIVHVCDTAGIGSILSKFQTLAGHEAKLICCEGLTDKYGIYDFYSRFIELFPKELFIQKLVQECRSADVVHVHSNIDFLQLLRSALGLTKKIILHYHGTDIRGLKIRLPHRSIGSDGLILSKLLYRKILHGYRHRKAQQQANLIFSSQKDLIKLVPKAIHIPIAIDTDHFLNLPRHRMNQQNNGLTFRTEASDMRLIMAHLKKHNIQVPLEVYDRTTKPIMYKDMPLFLSGYETYVDIRYVNGKLLGDLSSTALQALACGLSVIDYDMKLLESLPKEHQAPNVATKVLDLYTRA